MEVDVSLDPGPGCEIGGIIGWRTKQGRRGLGAFHRTSEIRRDRDNSSVSDHGRNDV